MSEAMDNNLADRAEAGERPTCSECTCMAECTRLYGAHPEDPCCGALIEIPALAIARSQADGC